MKKQPHEINILIGCEESQAVCKAFRELGFNAYSNDILPCSGGHPEWHIQGDVFEAINSRKWDMIILHPPCTYICNSGVRWLYNKDGSNNLDRWNKLNEAVEFFLKLRNPYCGFMAIENPVPHKHANIIKYSQTIQPYQFGDTASKRTCLWLHNLPELKPTNVIQKEQITHEIHKCPPSKDRAKIRSKTFPGIAKAMAEQWGAYLLTQNL